MTLWKTLVVALVAAFTLAACSSSDNGGTTSTETETSTTAEKTPTEQIAELQEQINELRAELGLAPIDIDSLTGSVTDLQGQVEDLKEEIEDRDEKIADAATEAMKARAAKLHAGISAATDNSSAETRRFAAYAGTNDSQIAVTIGTADAVNLSEDKKTMVAAHQDWTGKRYTAEPEGEAGTYEAVVYSNVAAPTPGRKFGSTEPGSGNNRPYEYLLAGGELSEANADGVGGTGDAFVPTRVAFEGVTRTAGTETWHLPDPNNLGQTEIKIPGSYHGVSGDYYCTPATAADGCSADVAAGGFTVAAGDTWTFTPDSADARVLDAVDIAYASYGWWIHVSEFGQTMTASVFVDEKGTASTAVDIANLVAGTATYMGGAAGKYALSSTTGGTNDAGHFTARVRLEADFAADNITGTIDKFMGADGESRDWEVSLMNSNIADAGGAIAGDPNDSTDTGAQMTAWTIGDAAADAAGSWSGTLREEGTDGVPEVVTGMFYSEYGTAGKMVGAFGANEQ